MNHADRCQFWKRPANEGDWLNSLVDAFAAMEPGKMLVYHLDYPRERLVGNEPPPENRVAHRVAATMGGALVQWPVEPSRGDNMVKRKWIYAIQKPTGAMAA